MSNDPKNIILISIDALRADHLSCYGYERETSPVLNQLATESIRFTNAYSASSHTREAIPALLTGKYPDVAVDDTYRLATDTIASTLSESGFATGGFHSNPFISRAYGFDRGFDKFDDDLHMGQHKFIALAQRALDKIRNRHYARAEEINDRSLAWIDSLEEGEQFFLWNHYMDTHGPYEPPGEYRTLYAEHPVSERKSQSLYQRAIKNPNSITEEEHQLLVNLYDAEIKYNDAKLGEMLSAIRERGILEESLLVVTSDHGDAFGEHGYYEHPRYLHDEITHVPLFVRPPGGVNDVIKAPVSTIDIASTFDSLISSESVCDGESLLPLSKYNESNKRTVFLQARGENNNNHLRRYSLRTIEGACFCDYNRKTGKLTFSDCSSQALRKELESHVEARAKQELNGNDSDSKEINKEIENRLRALGYKDP